MTRDERSIRLRLRIGGQVQGVGFRPFVYRLASECTLGGFVLNDSSGVLIEAQGAAAAVERFQSRLRERAAATGQHRSV